MENKERKSAPRAEPLGKLGGEQSRTPRDEAESQSPFEFLSEHLKKRVAQGGYEKEFQMVRQHIPLLSEFDSFVRFLKDIGSEKAYDFREKVVREVVTLYQDRWDLRPSTGVVLIMIVWGRLTRLAPGEWFDDGVYALLEEAELINRDEPELVEGLMEAVRRKLRGRPKLPEEPDEYEFNDEVADEAE